MHFLIAQGKTLARLILNTTNISLFVSTIVVHTTTFIGLNHIGRVMVSEIVLIVVD